MNSLQHTVHDRLHNRLHDRLYNRLHNRLLRDAFGFKSLSEALGFQKVSDNSKMHKDLIIVFLIERIVANIAGEIN